jgi:hypothetical protein
MQEADVERAARLALNEEGRNVGAGNLAQKSTSELPRLSMAAAASPT